VLEDTFGLSKWRTSYQNLTINSIVYSTYINIHVSYTSQKGLLSSLITPGNWVNWMFWCGNHLYSKQTQNIRHKQGDTSGNFIIFGGDNIGHCEKNKAHMNDGLILYAYRDTAVWINKYRHIVIYNTDREIV
jgi:hypothetical protein